MIIRVDRSGGLVGRTISHEIDSEDLPLTIKHKLKRMMKNGGSTSHGLESTPKGAADHFNYKITIKDGPYQIVISCSQYNIKGDLKSLVNYIEKNPPELK